MSYFNEMMKILALYEPNMMSWIFIETYSNNSLKADMSLLKHFLKFKPNNFAASYSLLQHARQKAARTNFTIDLALASSNSVI